MITKFFKILSLQLLVFSLLCNIVIAEETKTEPKKESTNAFMRFIDEYVLPEKNPIFQDNKNAFIVSYNISVNEGKKRVDGVGGGMFHRYVHNFALHYSQPNKFFRGHGRISFGIFSWHGVKGVYTDIFQAFGFELIQELAFGTPTLYITAGIGPSIAFGKLGRTSKRSEGLTPFNFASTIKIGHRFDCGAILEILYKHYSNGNLGVRNVGIDLIGLSFGYTF